MSDQKPILTESAGGGVTVIRFNRPDKRNALTFEMGEQLTEIVIAMKDDPDLRAVVVEGVGSSFCAGADYSLLQGWAGASDDDAKSQMLDFYRRFLRLRDLQVPTIAAVHGGAIGAGCCVALACDIRIAARDAKLAFNFVRLGLSPGMAATLNLPRLVGRAQALELLLSGRIIDGAEAARIGLVNRVVEPQQVADSARELATEIATAAPLAVRRAKGAVELGLSNGELNASLLFEATSQAACYRTEDYQEGMAAIREKRAPEYKGR